MTRSILGTDHVWLMMMKAMRALTRYGAAGIEKTGLGLSDFAVLEVLLHKGPLPVNTIGPIVDLTPGSISIAVDRPNGLQATAVCITYQWSQKTE